MMQTHRPLPRLVYSGGTGVPGSRELPDEVPVALSYNGTTQAVMMATPDALQDFARGFTLTDGIAGPAEIVEIAVVDHGGGIDLQIRLADGAGARLADRRRTMAGPVGCGLCGIDSIEQALRPPRILPALGLTLTAADICRAMADLPGGQVLQNATRAAHAAAFYLPGQGPGTGILLIREDVGRHNALDKLAGALIAAGIDAATGAVVMTSRVSIDLVQKCVAIGAPVLIAASAPTAQAVAMADAAGLTLAALVRGDRFELYSHPSRIVFPRAAHVA